jgi:hypothetical protein
MSLVCRVGRSGLAVHGRKWKSSRPLFKGLADEKITTAGRKPKKLLAERDPPSTDSFSKPSAIGIESYVD